MELKNLIDKIIVAYLSDCLLLTKQRKEENGLFPLKGLDPHGKYKCRQLKSKQIIKCNTIINLFAAVCNALMKKTKYFLVNY